MPDLSSFPHETLRALLDRLIPRDDFPGAIESGVEDYVLRQLVGDLANENGALIQGLRQLDAEATARHLGARFATLTPEQQDGMLRDIEAGQVATSWPKDINATTFFARLVDLAHEGFYADPGNGGNREAVSWRMVGYDPRLPREPKSRPGFTGQASESS